MESSQDYDSINSNVIRGNVLKTHCKHYLRRKKRFCKMTVKQGKEYCAEHQEIDITSDDTDNCEKQRRIICPLDNKHTCYAHKLKKHLKICNAGKTTTEKYISKGINLIDGLNELDQSTLPLSTFLVSEIQKTISKINIFYENHVHASITEKFSQCHLVEHEISAPHCGENSKKHLRQVSSILGLMAEYDLMKPKTCFVEFGAGRGQLSYWIARLTETDIESEVLLIERASPKHKKDNKLSNTINKIHRIRADISDIVLDNVSSISQCENIVGVTKHLCGEATDIMLRCLENVSTNRHKIEGCLITQCCHHRCRWLSYAGKDFLIENGFNKNDFDILCGISSWATCGDGLSRDKRKEINAPLPRQNVRDIEMGLNREQKAEIGRRSKRVIDWGRLLLLSNLGFRCRLHYYVNTEVSLENVCIVASR